MFITFVHVIRVNINYEKKGSKEKHSHQKMEVTVQEEKKLKT